MYWMLAYVEPLPIMRVGPMTPGHKLEGRNSGESFTYPK